MKYIATILFTFILNMCYGQQDTIKVIMIYSDTALTELVGVNEEGDEYQEIGLDEYTYWRKGYVIRKFVPQHWENGDYQVPAQWEDVCLLDADKKPIPKTNVVWQYKQIR